MRTYVEYSQPVDYIPPQGPRVNTVGILIVPSVLSVKFVMTAIGESMENSYETGVPLGNLFLRSFPSIVVVP